MRRFLRLVLLILAAGQNSHAQAAGEQTNVPGAGARAAAQVSFASLKPLATIKVGGTADWVLIADDAVWVAGTRPYTVRRIDPATNRMVAAVPMPGEACSGLAYGFGSVWVPICGKHGELVRIDVRENKITAILPQPPAGPEGGIAVSEDSVWMVTDDKGTLVRIDPSNNSVRQRITIAPGSFNPVCSNGIVWITSIEGNALKAVDANSGKVLDSISVGPKPRFLTAGGGSIWTLNQADGTISRVDEKSRKVIATIEAGTPGKGGDIDYGDGSVWSTIFNIPLTRVDATTNKVVKQWVGPGGDSLRFGFGSIWITDYKRGLLLRIPINELKGR